MMQQSTINQFFRPKSKSSSSVAASSSTSINDKLASFTSSSGSKSQKRVREEISLIDDEIEEEKLLSPIKSNVKDRLLEILGNNSSSLQKRRKLQEVLFENSQYLRSDHWEEAENDALNDDLSNEGDVPMPATRVGITKKNNYTPLETQVVTIHRQYPDCLLMVECGYRMRFFGDDALKAAAILGIYAHKDHNFMVASIPTYRAAYHCQRLLSQGQKVAIVRQTETAALRKGNTTVSRTFDRKVAGVFTHGTLIDEDDPAFEGLVSWFNKSNSKEKQSSADISDDDNEEGGGMEDEVDQGGVSAADSTDEDVWIAAVHEEEKDNAISIIGVNIRAHKLWICNLSVDSIRQSLIDYSDILKPVELIYSDSLPSITKDRIAQRVIASEASSGDDGEDRYIQLVKIFPVTTFTTHREKYLGIREGTAWYRELSLVSQRAIHGLFHYLTEFHLQHIFLSPTIMTTSNISEEGGEGVQHELLSRESFPLDGITIRDLEIFDTLSTTNAKLRKVWKELWSIRTSGSMLSGSQTKWKSLQHGLFGMIDHCRTIYGKRTLKQWLMNPLRLRERIIERQEVIDWFLQLTKRDSSSNNSRSSNQTMMIASQQKQAISEIFQSCLEIEKLLTSLQYQRISFPKLLQLLFFAIRLEELSGPLFNPSVDNTLPFPVLLTRWLTAVNWQEIATIAKKYLVKLKTNDSSQPSSSSSVWKEPITTFFTLETELQYPRLQAFQQQRQHYEQLLGEELQKLRELLHKPQLQYTTFRSGTNSQIEHLIEIPVSDLNRLSIPSNWIKVNTTKQLHRYHVPSVLALQDALYKLRDESKFYAQEIWREFITEMTQTLYPSLRQAIEVLGQFDAILSLSVVASFPNYCKPIFPEHATTMTIEEGRHPLLEKSIEFLSTLSPSSSTAPMLPLISDMIIPNDVQLSHSFQSRHCQIITGPNMGGKSSYVRMVGLLVLLAQIGSYLPATQASLCIFENIFTRMGSEDDLSSGRSTFFCELIRMKKILSSIQSKSLVIIDELGRGTSTHDGLAIAQATLQYLSQKIGCCTLFITHFPQIAAFVEYQRQEKTGKSNTISNTGCFNSHMSYLERKKLITATSSSSKQDTEEEEEEQEIIFLYKIVDEPSQGSYGINVARLAGIPKPVLRKAIVASAWMSQQQ